jgi:hypothetical protein
MSTEPTEKAQRIIISDPVDVGIRLRSMELTADVLAAAVRMGQDARSSCTLNDPPMETGIHGWGRTVRGLRENALALGWVRFDDDHIHGVINADGTLVIAVATGDAATGRVGPDPKTAYPKGVKMQAAVKRNAAQLCLFKDVEIVPIRKSVTPNPKCLLWLLVACESDDEVRFELSLPDSVGEDERVDKWVERIVLAPIPIDPTPKERIDADMEPNIDIPLTRKS